MEIRRKYLIVVLCFLSSCSSVRFLPTDFKGTYLRQDDKNERLVFNEGTFLYINTNEQMDAPPYKCCDTLAYGYWSIDKEHGLIKLNSPEELNTTYVHMNVEEKTGNLSDTIYFFIHNPIEDHYKKYNEKHRELFYSISVTSNNADFDARLAAAKYDTNPIKLLKPQNVTITSFSVIVNPNCDIPVKNIGIREINTLEYEIIEPNSNVFIVRLPQLNYNFINHRRLIEDFVKISNKNKLIWDGKEYLKFQ